MQAKGPCKVSPDPGLQRGLLHTHALTTKSSTLIALNSSYVPTVNLRCICLQRMRMCTPNIVARMEYGVHTSMEMDMHRSFSIAAPSAVATCLFQRKRVEKQARPLIISEQLRCTVSSPIARIMTALTTDHDASITCTVCWGIRTTCFALRLVRTGMLRGNLPICASSEFKSRSLLS